MVVKCLMQRSTVIGPMLVAGVLTVLFWVFSSGWSLRVTFVPGMIAAACLYLSLRGRKLSSERLNELYLLGIACQLLHFAEEYLTRFDERFPVLFGGEPYPRDIFVMFNLLSYAVFIVGWLGLKRGIQPLFIPALFFVTYGMIGNAIMHVVFCIMVGGYFPGIYTSLLYWLLGPLTLREILRSA
jgi:Protein of unknown function with HXXEE motif